MRRLAAISILLGDGRRAARVRVRLGASAQGSRRATFDVIFDDARGLIGGQLVKVAGAQAGTIENVTVTSDFKARIEASIESQFMPFRANATCTIRPEGLIAENYIDCNPGSPPAPVLKSEHGFPPTVPVQNTTEPVSLLDLFNIFNLPTRERFQVIINELGIGTAGEGQNFNDILRRANPALHARRPGDRDPRPRQKTLQLGDDRRRDEHDRPIRARRTPRTCRTSLTRCRGADAR